MLQRCFHGFLLLLLVNNQLNAQQVLFHNYSYAQGLTTYNIFKTLQDPYGFIWVVTQDGAYRYNGRAFEVFKKNTSRPGSLNGVAILDMAKGTDSSILFASYNVGVEKMSVADLAVKTVTGSIPNQWIKKIYLDSLGTIWVGGKDFLAWKTRRDSNFQVMKPPAEFHEEIEVNFIRPLHWPLLAIGIDKYGTIFFDIHSQKIVYTLRIDSQQCATGPCRIFDFIPGDGDSIFAISSAGLLQGRLTASGWVTDKQYADPVFTGRIFNDFLRDRQNRFWFATSTGLIRYEPNTGQSALFTAGSQQKFSLYDNGINHLMLDSQDNLWLSTSTSLQRISLKTPFFRYFSGEGPGSDPMEHVFTLRRKNDDEIYATGTDGLYLTRLSTGTTKRIPGSSGLGLIHHMEQLETDLWVLSADEGMFAYIPSRQKISKEDFLLRFPEWIPLAQHYFNAVFHDGDDSYWASEEQEGLIRWNRKNGTITQFKSGTARSGGLTENHIHNLSTDREKNLWLLLDNTVARFDTRTDTVNQMFRYTQSKQKSGFNADVYFDMYDDGEWLWFGTYGGGINGVSKKTGQWKYITENDGLSNNCVYSILPENDSIFWVSTNSGLSRVNSISKSCTNFFQEDGLQDNSFDEKGSLVVGRKIYFGGLNGFTEVDLDRVNTTTTNFPTYCYRIEYHTGNKSYMLNNLSWNRLVLPPGTNIISLHLAALRFNNNQITRFSYRIDGVQDEYIEVAENNVITLNTLTYGNYLIHVRYRQQDGSFGEPMSFEFYIQPRWYQQWWFRALLGVLFLGLVYGIYLNRVAQIRKEEKMRRKFASDLHDDIGSTLNSIKVFANHFLTRPGDLDLIRQIKDQTQHAIAGVRDLIWVLNDNLDTVGDVVYRFEQFAATLADTKNIKLEKNIPAEIFDMKLRIEIKRNFYLILKESFNNCIKYADADIFGYSFQPGGPGRPKLTIHDNGRGFDLSAHAEGYGLKNMKERAAQIGYHFSVSSGEGSGTIIVISPV